MFVIESDDLSQVPVQLKPIILQDNNKSSLSSGFVSELSLHSLSNNSFGCSMPSIRISSDSLLELDYFNDALDSSKRVYTSDSELSSTSGKFSLSRRLVKETQRIECLTASNLASDTYSSLNSSSDIVFGKTMINEYAIIKDIGHGTFSTVRLLYNTLDGKYYAGKCVSKKRMKKLGMLKKGPVRKKKFQDGKNGQDEIENLYNINKIKEENNKQVDVSFEDKSIAYNKSEKDKLDLGRKEINLGPPDEIKSQIYESNKPNDGENQTTSVDKKTGEKHGISDQNISNKNKDTTVCQTLTKEIVLKKVESRDFMDLVRREIAILKKLSLHPNVASLLEVLDDESHDSLYMIFELCEYGSIMRIRVGEISPSFSEPLCRRYFRDVLSGLHYLHSMGIIHRDIKPENILLNSQNHAVIGDFSISYSLDHGRNISGVITPSTSTPCSSISNSIPLTPYSSMPQSIREEIASKKTGHDSNSVLTPIFTPPELIPIAGNIVRRNSSWGYNEASADVYALGLTLFALSHGTTPFSKSIMSLQEIYAAILNVEMKNEISPTLPQGEQDVILLMTRKSWSERVSLDDILVHPWVTKNGTETIHSNLN